MMPIFRMTAASFDPDTVRRLGSRLGAEGDASESAGSTVVSSDERVLVAGGACSRQPGVLMYLDGRYSLGQVHERTVPAEHAIEYAMNLLGEFDLLPSTETADGHELRYEPSAQVTEAVEFDGRERRTAPARTDFRLRMHLDGVPVDGPRSRVRMAFGIEEQPILFYRALWDRLDAHDEVEPVSEEEVLAVLRERLNRRGGRNPKMTVHSSKFVYMADDYRGEPDLLTPSYLVEIEGPGRLSSRAGEVRTPRQLLRLPAWRTPARPKAPAPA